MNNSLTKRYTEKFPESLKTFEKFKGLFPRGVCHDIRYFEPFPFVTKSAEGVFITTAEDEKILDLWMGHYANILGHNPPEVMDFVTESLKSQIHTGTTNVFQLVLAQEIKEAVPELESFRFCTSGTEATMYAIRVAKHFTKKPIVVKMEGGWHGGNSELAHQIKPPFKDFTPETMGVKFNDIEATLSTLENYKDKIACIIIEPVMGAGGGVAAEKGYLLEIRKFCNETGALLIFDETVTGFRFRYGSIWPVFGVKPDMFTMGKIIGGGFAIGLYGGKKEIMDVIERGEIITGGGTFSAHPASMSSGLVTLVALREKNYNELNIAGNTIQKEIHKLLKKYGLNAVVRGFNSLFSITFFDESLEDFSVSNVMAKQSFKKEQIFKMALILNGLYTMHSGGALSFAHLTDGIVNKIMEIYEKTIKEMADNNFYE